MKTMIAAACIACAFVPASIMLPASASAADVFQPYDVGSSAPPRVMMRTVVEAPLAERYIVERPRLEARPVAAPVIVRREPVPTRIIEQRIVQQPGVTTKVTRIYDSTHQPAHNVGALYAPRPPRDIPVMSSGPYGNGYFAASAPAYRVPDALHVQPMHGGYEVDDFE